MSMFKQLAYAALCTATVYVAGCGGSSGSKNNNPDLSVNDLAVVGDMASPSPKTYTATTVNTIDTTSPKGNFSVDNLYVFTSVKRTTYTKVKNGPKYCEYYVFTQDATCNTPPCGIVVFAETSVLPSPSSNPTGEDCPYADAVPNQLNAVKQGDTINVQGYASYFSGKPFEHYIDADTVTVAAPLSQPSPIPLTDPTLFESAPIYPYDGDLSEIQGSGTGSGWQKYEGTYVRITPTNGPFTIGPLWPTGSPLPVPSPSPGTSGGTPDGYGNFVATVPSPAPATSGVSTLIFDLGSIYYGPLDMGTFPAPASTYHTLGGWVYLNYGGSILPVDSGDFVP